MFDRAESAVDSKFLHQGKYVSTQRAIIGLHPDADLSSVKAQLYGAGAQQLSGPAPELPDVLIATLPSTANLRRFLQAAQRTPGVRYAEADAWGTTF